MVRIANFVICGFLARVHAECMGEECQQPLSPSLLQKVAYDTTAGAAYRASKCSLDVVLVLDSSGSIKDFNWPKMIQAASTFAANLMKSSGSRLGVLKFSNDVQWISRLSSNIASVKTAVEGAKYENPGWTNTQLALKEAGNEMKSKGSMYSHHIVVVITDGRPTTSKPDASDNCGDSGDCTPHEENARTQAKFVKSLPCDLAMVAVGDADSTYMKSLVTTPTKDNYFTVNDFLGLSDNFINNLVDKLCERGACLKDTRATCSSPFNLCFQTTRGATDCVEPSAGAAPTCHCTQDDECVYWVDMLGTKNGSWGVCRKHRAGDPSFQQDPDDVRGEKNAILWFFHVAWDILRSYASMSSSR